MTRKEAIDAMCRACIVDPLAPGNWRQQVGACQITTCPLYGWRPVSRPRKRKRT